MSSGFDDPGRLPGIPSAQIDPFNLQNGSPQAGPASQRIGGSGIRGTAAPDLVYLGTREVVRYIRGTSKRVFTEPELVPLNDARYMLDTLAPDRKETIYGAMDAYYGKGRWDKTYIPKIWERAINVSANSVKYGRPGEELTPIDAFVLIAREDAAGMRASGQGGAGYGGTSVSSTVQLTNPQNARTLVNNALTQYLGRRASPKEATAFYKALNAQQEANPLVTTTTRGGSSAAAVSRTVQEGGFDPSTFADDYARGMEGSAEFQAATTLLDTFIGSLKARV